MVSLTPLILAVFAILSVISTVSAGYTSTSWQSRIVSAHNAARSLKKLPALKWSTNLERLACKCASSNAAKGSMNHCRVGENMYSCSKSASPLTAGAGALSSWVAEKSKYSGQSISSSLSALSKFGHYTQVMWKNTKSVGCCMKTGKTTVVVCNYDPPGNYIGQKPY
ncbi:hypothetical protein HDV00_000008 [Rhizophlyctis rosea]|nr:hypothetical protein HDV00_000008 [Rhizophlyctis rosea]